MTKDRNVRIWRFLLPLLIVGSLFACNEEPGLVGESFVESTQEFRFDTLFIDNINEVNYNTYTGLLQFAAMGSYQDPLYGEIVARTLIKPDIREIPAITTISEAALLQLQLTFDDNNVWGDTTSTTEFNVYNVSEIWRGGALLADDAIAYNSTDLVATFTRENQDTVTFDLPAEFLDEYRALYNSEETLKDSLFSFGFNGLLIEPVNATSKLAFLDATNSNLLVTNPSDTGAVAINLRDYGYTLERSNDNIPADRLLIHSTNESMLQNNFFSQLEPYNSSNIIKVELVLFQDTTTMDATIPFGHVRTQPLLLNSHQGLDLDPNYDFTFAISDSLGFVDIENNTYRFNLTAYANRYLFGDGNQEDFFFSILEQRGIISSTLLHNANSDASRRPIMIITTIEL